MQLLEKDCEKLDLKRVDQNSDGLEAAFEIEFKNSSQVNKTLKVVNKLGKSAEVSLIDQSGIVV